MVMELHGHQTEIIDRVAGQCPHGVVIEARPPIEDATISLKGPCINRWISTLVDAHHALVTLHGLKACDGSGGFNIDNSEELKSLSEMISELMLATGRSYPWPGNVKPAEGVK